MTYDDESVGGAGNNGAVHFSDGMPFQRTSLGLWVPAQREGQSSGSDLPLLVAERLHPEPGTLLLTGKRSSPSEAKAFFTEEEIDPARASIRYQGMS
jgi:hypothetical protein